MRRAIHGLVLGFALSGCAGGAGEAQIRDLRARLDASERGRAEVSRKMEELDNRVFLLQDQVESQKIALAQREAAAGGRVGEAPRLPVVTLSPVDRDEPAPSEVGGPEDPDPPPQQLTVSDGQRRKVTLEGNATPWLQEGGAPAGEANPSRKARRSPLAKVPAKAAQPIPPKPHLEAKAGAGIETSESLALSSPGEDPTGLYRAAYGKLKAGQPEQAASELRAFVQRFPHHDLADNAQYWLGETFYARADYRAAILEFRTVIRRWPAGNKAPDALLKLGFCHQALGELPEAKVALSEVVSQYPRTDAAQLASRRLTELPAENKK